MDVNKSIQHWKERTGNLHFEPKAALIDMDGTLYDSMPNHTASWYRLMTERGVECTREEFYQYEGMTGAQTITRLFNRQWGTTPTDEEIKRLYHLKTVYFNELPVVSPMAGAQDMVKLLLDKGITTVLVTGSGQPSVLNRLVADYPGAFLPEHRVTAHNVTHGKPHPEPYLKGMELAGVESWQSIAIENAPVGVKSAVASGAFTIAVTTGPIPETMLWDAGADIVLHDMQEVKTLLETIL